MSDAAVLCLGEVLFDCLEVANEPRQCFLGGAPANVACGLVKLGVPTAFLGAVGDDPLGAQAQAALGAMGVDVSSMETVAGVPTRQVRVRLNSGGDRQFVGFAPEDAPVFADTQFLGSRVRPEQLNAARFLVSGTLGLAAEPTATTVASLVAQLAAQGKPIFIDANWRPIFWPDTATALARIPPFLATAQFLKLAKEEAELFFSSSDPQLLYRQLWGEGGDRAVVITDGGDPIHYCWHGHCGTIIPPALPVVDTTGAGDGFVAGWLYQLVNATPADYRQPQWQQACLEFAAVVGALVTTQKGAITAQPTLAEVKAWLRDHPQRKIERP
ncbi:carbohydrate kinase [Thermosynechococcaceae cyanobacterium Okahandja]